VFSKPIEYAINIESINRKAYWPFLGLPSLENMPTHSPENSSSTFFNVDRARVFSLDLDYLTGGKDDAWFDDRVA
jgi:hypothetical protein